MSKIESSIIIPVFNNWSLTSQCLESVAANTDLEKLQVIVVDNASSDATQKECPVLGKRLFGDNFTYIRNGENRNFAGACNQGAAAAAGSFLIFLNNDTEVQPGWHQPLLDDFVKYPHIAGTGPILAYPEEGVLGRVVQHLGVTLTLWMHVFHLHQGIPAASPLAKKRRFFQVITAACMVMPKNLFMEMGGFDEGFINGFEDVDLCARICKSGRSFTINPDSLVLHHESRTPGRSAYESENARRIQDGSLNYLLPDQLEHAKNDGFEIDLDKWGVLSQKYPSEILQRLDPLAKSLDLAELKDHLVNWPFWEKGWHELIARTKDRTRRLKIFDEMFPFFKTPENAITGCNLALNANNQERLAKYFRILREFLDSPENMRANALENQRLMRLAGFDDLAAKFGHWLENYSDFKAKTLPALARSYLKLAGRMGYEAIGADPVDYNMWRLRKPAPESGQASPDIAFSIVMPVYNTNPDFLRQAIDSALAQTWPNWELCIADDASTNPRIREIIEEYALKDPRVRHVFRHQSGHIAAATNSALALARNPWCAFMDHDDRLAPNALECMARAITANPDGQLFFSDEDIITECGHHCRPYFKPGKWDAELIRQQNFVCHLTVVRTAMLREKGALREGFPGSQDHEMILRITEGLADGQIIHIPEILYHWRSHDESMAKNADSKKYAFESSKKAIQAHLDRACPGARATPLQDKMWMRVHYPPPSPAPLASIIPTSGFFPYFQAFNHARTSYPYEIVNSPEDAKGEILLFLGGAFLPYSRYWLEEMASCLWREGIGAVGGSLLTMRGVQLHGGYLADGSGNLKPVFKNAEKDLYNGWLSLARVVDAVDGFCLMTRKSDFMALNGLDEAMGQWAFQDYCLRLEERRKRVIWWPYAKFIAGKAVSLPPAPEIFNKKWRLPPFNKNLKIIDMGFALDAGA